MPSGKSIWHGLTWRGLTEATWKLSLLDSISNMRFFKFNALLFLSTLTHPFTLSEPHQSNPLPLSALSVRPSPSLSLTDLDPLSLTLSFSHSSTHCHTSLSLFLLSHSSSTLTQSLVPSVRGIGKKKKKKSWIPLCKMQSVFHRLVAKK